MAASENLRKAMAGQPGPVQRKIALVLLKRAARRELQRIFDEEVRQRRAERRSTIARPATASQSHS